MSKQTHRINGGLVDRSRNLSFTFNKKIMQGYPGDTLASALLANGQRLIGRSFKYHRPRGIFTAGSEEPNALVQLNSGSHQEPNTRATVAELFDGLNATSQNHRGSLEFDLMAIADLISPFLSTGFYYKTFMWPKAFWEKIYEPAIRISAGLGSLSMQEDPDIYDKGFLHCDLLIIGAGPTGLAAALAAGRSGAQVILADEDFRVGGRLNAETYEIDGISGSDWALQILAELSAFENVRLMVRTTIYGAYDHGIFGALERRTDHLSSSYGKPRQVLWRIYAKRSLITTGATERQIAFGNNDRPGIMLAGAVRTYVNRYGVAPGKQVAIFSNNDDGWRTAMDLSAKGIYITAVIDTRDIDPPICVPGVDIYMGRTVIDTNGRKDLRSITLETGDRIKADCLAISGGWNPNVHLTCHQRSKPKWRDDINAFVPSDELPYGMLVAGSANGSLSLGSALREGTDIANNIIIELGFNAKSKKAPVACDEPKSGSSFWYVSKTQARSWLDLQNDVTVKDIKQSYQEGFRSVEHLKRYTTLGMATDQGKTANVLALAIMAECTGKTIAETGTTIYRPPLYANFNWGSSRSCPR